MQIQSGRSQYQAKAPDGPEDSRELLFALLGVLAVLLIGTVGYMAIEKWSAIDSLYMTVITLSTVGYGETHSLSVAGRVFTILLIFVGVGVGVTVLTMFARHIIARQVYWVFRRKGMQQQLNSVSDHTIFCGFGRLSRIAIDALLGSGMPGDKLVVIDTKEERCHQAEELGLLCVHGDATFDQVLEQAGVTRARRLVSMLPKDSDNLYVILTTREMNDNTFILSRAEDEQGEKRMLQAGANRIIAPYRIGGNRIAEGLLRPHVTDFLDLAVATQAGDLQIEEIVVPEGSPLHGLSLRDSGIRDDTNVIVVAIVDEGKKMTFNPMGETLLETGSTLICLGPKEDFTTLGKMLVGSKG